MPTSKINAIDELSTLAKLHAEGALSDEEFKTLKANAIAKITASSDEKENSEIHATESPSLHQTSAAIRPVAGVDIITGRAASNAKKVFQMSGVLVIALIFLFMVTNQDPDPDAWHLYVLSWLGLIFAVPIAFWSGIVWLGTTGIRELILEKPQVMGAAGGPAALGSNPDHDTPQISQKIAEKTYRGYSYIIAENDESELKLSSGKWRRFPSTDYLKAYVDAITGDARRRNDVSGG